MLKHLKITDKLLLTNLVSALIILLTAGALLIWQSYREHHSFFEQRMQQAGKLVANNMTAAVMFDDWESVNEILRSLGTDKAILSASFYDNSGIIKAQFEHNIPEEELNNTVFKPLYSTSVVVREADNHLGYIEMSATAGEINAVMKKNIISISFITLISVSLGIFLAARIQRTLTKPIESLSSLVHNIQSTGDYALRAEDAGTLDEIGVLTNDVNAMLAIIERRDADLQELVNQRTEALREQNEVLENEVSERIKSEERAKDTQKRFESAFQFAPIGMALISEDLILFQRNSALNRILKFDVTRHRSCSLLDFVADQSISRLQLQFERLIDGGIENLECNFDCIDYSGLDLNCILNFSAIRDGHGKFVYAVMQLRDVTESKRLSDELTYQATHDVLTGLANRRAFESNFEKLRTLNSFRNSPSALCLLDLDQFKVVNDTCGHEAGDELLVQIANILRESVREEDLAVRLGGDEFAVLLENCSAEKSQEIAESIRQKIENLVFSWDNSTFRIGASIGVITMSNAPSDLSDILRQADAACFSAKDAGRNRVYTVKDGDSELKEKRGEMHWVHRIHTAMEQNDFIIYAQPIVRLDGSPEPERLELLLRLRNREKRSVIPPGAFLPAAERYGLMPKLDQWVVKNLIQMLETYDYLFQENRKFWVNLSGHSLGDDKFLAFLEDQVSNSSLPPGGINFEVTETSVIRNISQAADVMNRMKLLGCRFALDDFGTGLSSFSYLKALPVDVIKIDGMFVKGMIDNPVDRIFVKSIIDIGKVLGTQTVAEFVETAELRDILIDMGAEYGQGFALGKPQELIPTLHPSNTRLFN